MSSHLWFLQVTEHAREDIRNLPTSKQRLAVLAAIAELLKADNPTTSLGVRKLIGERFSGLWRLRQGNYRIFFYIEHGELVDQKFAYKGTLTIVSVTDRKEAYE